ncbi:MAG: uroporphyrinogen-III C-methyltransferase [Planctomycetota bacterium]|nr:uroporphyrinogen-III C-methyltransferase [Planctomycetota bacterium]
MNQWITKSEKAGSGVNRQMTSPEDGRVYLVGAGPGDPGLITVRGFDLLKQADVVLYDFLVNPLILEPVPETAEQICLGRHGRGRIWTQAEINQKMVDYARQGKKVIRLKGGDPGVFGRLAEEVESLNAAGIAWEVVPGISAALAAPSYAGVFMTHRKHASAVAMVTGHEQETVSDPKIDFPSLAKFPGTLIFYMGVTTAPIWTKSLIEAGRDPKTPVAIVRRCSMSDQQAIYCTLEEVAAELSRQKLRPPAVVLVDYAAQTGSLSCWFTQKPLLGQTILITRPRTQALPLSRMLTELGAGCLLQPAIKITAPIEWEDVDAAIGSIEKYDWLVFSSVNGVHFFFERFCEIVGDLRRLGNIRLAAIGPQTTAAVESYRLKVDRQPDIYSAEELAAILEAEKGDQFLLARANRGREVLAETLRKAGATVDQVIVYESTDVTEVDPDITEAMANQQIDWVTVTSSAIARSLVSLFGPALQHVRLASISPITSAVLRELGHEPTVEAKVFTMEGVVAAIHQHTTQLQQS